VKRQKPRSSRQTCQAALRQMLVRQALFLDAPRVFFQNVEDTQRQGERNSWRR